MTTICAVHVPGDGTWVGADTRACYGESWVLGPAKKWFGAHGWAVGQAGDLRCANLIEHAVSDIFHKCDDPLTVCDRIRKLLKDNDFNKDDEPGPPTYEQGMIICAPKSCGRGIWTLGSDFGFVAIAEGELCAEGSGREFAVGAAHATAAGGREKVEAALAAAITYDRGSGGEPFIARLEDVARNEKDRD